MLGGYAGKLLLVDLTRESFEVKDLSEALAENFIGGYGLGARVLYDMIQPGIDPLGPENIIGFVTGPLTLSGAFFSGRYTVVCVSPVTGGWNDANSGGFFGPELKRAGFDAVFVSGKAARPVYIWINDGQVEIRDAGRLWGKDTSETMEALIGETGEEKLRAAVIGPAGEKLSLMACVINDGHRAAGRGGCGAVMGSKNLKALVVRGTQKINIADPEKLKEINSSVREQMKSGPMALTVEAFGEYGTGITTVMSVMTGDSPIKNWRGAGVTDFPDGVADKLAAADMDMKYKSRKYACANCPLGCGAEYEVSDGDWPLGKTHRPEYETMCSFGSLCLNNNSEAVMKCNDICNRYGLDTISVGATIAWAMECYENGLFYPEDIDGIELTWGNAPAIVAITQAMAEQKGFGKILALGSRGAAQKLGKGFEYLQTVRGMELPMHDAKFSPGYARTYFSDPTPARHVKGGLGMSQLMGGTDKYIFENTGSRDLAATVNTELVNSAGLCMFSDFVAIENLVAKYLEAVTGLEFNEEKISNTGIRIFNMRHLFNLREGQTPPVSEMPDRAIGIPPLNDGPLAGITIDHKALQGSFCREIKWDEESWRPSRESLEQLGGLDDVIKDLYG